MWRRDRLLGLEKVLVAKQDDKKQKGEGHQAAHISATAAAPAALPLKIGIAEFCQGILPVRLGLFSAHGEARRQAAALPMVMVRGETGVLSQPAAPGRGRRE
jgi:hypothetical protein